MENKKIFILIISIILFSLFYTKSYALFGLTKNIDNKTITLSLNNSEFLFLHGTKCNIKY